MPSSSPPKDEGLSPPFCPPPPPKKKEEKKEKNYATRLRYDIHAEGKIPPCSLTVISRGIYYRIGNTYCEYTEADLEKNKGGWLV